MKKIMTMMALIALGLTAACSSDDPINETIVPNPGTGDGTGTTTPGGQTTGTLAQLLALDVALDETSLSETETTPDATDTYYEDYAELSEGFTENKTVYIAYNGSTATVSGDVSSVGVERGAQESDVIITSTIKGVNYVLSGQTSDGSFKIYSSKKFMVTLNGVDITNPTGAAFNNQGKRCYLVLADGTENSLADGASYTSTPAGEDEKGTLFSEGKLALSGTGKLSITSSGKHGLVSDDYILFRPGVNVKVVSTSGHAIKSNDGIIIRGGVINAQTSATAAKAIKTDGNFEVSGGRTTALTTGSGEYDSTEGDVSGAAGVKADSVIVISGGELRVKSTGKGGKGISTDSYFTLSGGKVTVVTTASAYTYGSLDTKSKGVKADSAIVISGGEIYVKATGGEGSEGIESKEKITINGGTVATYTYDDGINADDDLGSGDLVVNDGFVFCYATNNDGIDANGNLTINGGVVIGLGGNSPEEGLDAAEGKTLAINGGVVVGLGGGGEALSGSQLKFSQRLNSTLSSGGYLVVSSDGTNLFALQLPRTFSSPTLQVSHPSFASGKTAAVSVATAATGTDNIFGYIASPTLSGTTTSVSTGISVSQTTQGGMGGGGFPGGGGGGRR